MICFPPCKINLGLNIVRKRNDGYHDIETCFMPVPWCDVLEILPAAETRIHQTGIPISGEPTSNIVYKAFDLLRVDYQLPSVEIHLHKVIPHGAGLGGGSSDAAFALKLLSTLFNLQLSNQQLHHYALKLGSDCPFFLDPKPMLGFGRGDVLEPVSLELSGKFITLIKPAVHVSTADAYSGVIPIQPSVAIKDVLVMPLAAWRSHLKNDFEESVCKRYPIINDVKQALYEAGALYASMSGSGSTVYGIFDRPFNGEDQYPEFNTWSGQI